MLRCQCAARRLRMEVRSALPAEWRLFPASIVMALVIGACGGNVRASNQPVPLATPAEGPTAQSAGAVEGTEPARPAPDPPLTLSDFTSYETCSSCHPQQAEQWQSSAHAHSMTDPVFRALVARAEQDALPLGSFCISCHSSVGIAAKAVPQPVVFGELAGIVMEGVTCEGCHRVSAVLRPANAGHVLEPRGPMQGTVRAGAASPYHETERSPVLGTSELCGSCHDVQLDSGVDLESPYAEWRDSPAHDDGLVCIDCHMPRTLGRAAEGFDLAERPVRRHTFLGLGALTAAVGRGEPDAEELKAQVRALLGQSVSVRVEGDIFVSAAGARLHLMVHNHVVGHRLPTGSAFFRQLWLRVWIGDDKGNTLYDSMVSGDDSRPGASRFLFSARLLDERNEPTLYPWRAAALKSTALRAGEERLVTVSFPLGPSIRGPLRVEASLEMRAFPAELIEELGVDARLAEPMTIFKTASLRSVKSECGERVPVHGCAGE